MSSRFENCIEELLSQNIICEIANADNFSYLDNPENEESINSFLHLIGRKVARTNDRKGYYCVFNSIEEPKKRNTAQRHFEHLIINLEGLIDWLRLVRSIDNESRPIEAGMRVHESELLAAIEESSSLKLQLDNIAHKLKRAQKSSESKAKLRSILQYLVDDKYFISMGSSGAVYVATAKWSLIYDQLEFIRMYDGFESDVGIDEEQKELF